MQVLSCISRYSILRCISGYSILRPQSLSFSHITFCLGESELCLASILKKSLADLGLKPSYPPPLPVSVFFFLGGGGGHGYKRLVHNAPGICNHCSPKCGKGQGL